MSQLVPEHSVSYAAIIVNIGFVLLTFYFVTLVI